MFPLDSNFPQKNGNVNLFSLYQDENTARTLVFLFFVEEEDSKVETTTNDNNME